MRLLLPAAGALPVAPSASQKRLSCYMIAQGSAYVMTVKAAPMGFWPWLLFTAGFLFALATTYRAFLDQTLSRQDPPPDMPADQKPDVSADQKQSGANKEML